MRSFVLPEIESHAAASLAGLRAGETAAMGWAPSDLEAPHRTPPGTPSTADRARSHGRPRSMPERRPRSQNESVWPKGIALAVRVSEGTLTIDAMHPAHTDRQDGRSVGQWSDRLSLGTGEIDLRHLAPGFLNLEELLLLKAEHGGNDVRREDLGPRVQFTNVRVVEPP
jgi:hypothetical protein